MSGRFSAVWAALGQPSCEYPRATRGERPGHREAGGGGAATAVAPDAVTHPYPHRFDGALFYYTTIDGVVTLPPQHRESRWSRAQGGCVRGG